MVNFRQNLDLTTFHVPPGASVEWRISDGAVDYLEAVATMEARAAQIAAGEAGELVWLLEHPPLYTAGVSAKPADLLAPGRVPRFESGRGGGVAFLTHPPPSPAGFSPPPADLLAPGRFPVFESGRGGQFTYHGPGQRVAYVMLDLTRRRRDVRAFVAALEAWVIGALAQFNVDGAIREGRV